MKVASRKAGFAIGIAALVMVLGITVLVPSLSPERESARYSLAGFEPMTPDDLSDRFFLVAPDMLTRVYLAFNETEEAAIYDNLAQVAADDALEALYLERVGAMAGGGLDPASEADQQIHTMEMLRIDTARDGEIFTWDARWRVVGTVGHATHLHVRGNIYAAVLTVAPSNGAWRITGFELTDVDRTEAGQIVPADPELPAPQVTQ